MRTVEEKDLAFEFADALHAVNFDCDEVRGKSCMNTVDFIVEYEDRRLFVEVKDPDAPDTANPAAFHDKMGSETLVQNLARKFRDGVFFQHFKDGMNKRAEYVVLISMRALDDALLLAKQDELCRSIPIKHDHWKGGATPSCAILNLEQWKKRFGENSVWRLSDQSK